MCRPMSGGHRIRPYPWQALQRLSRQAVQSGARARRAVARRLDLTRFADRCSEVLGAVVSVLPESTRALDAPRTLHPCAVCAGDSSASVGVWLFVDPALLEAVVSRLLARPVALTHPSARMDPAIQGAFAAACAEALRRAHAGSSLSLLPQLVAPTGPGTQFDFTVLIDVRAFAASAWVVLSAAPTTEHGLPPAQALTTHLRDVALSVPVVVAWSAAIAEDLAMLAPGDAWLPGANFRHEPPQPVVLAAANAECGVSATLAEGGQVVLGGTLVPLSVEEPVSEQQPDEVLAEAAASAPLIVRVELGSVSLTGKQWAELGPGDVIEVGRRVSEPVILRIAGREVARGELVDVEGELGVRIRSIGGTS